MSVSLFNGQIVPRDDGVFTEGNVPFDHKFASGMTPFDLLREMFTSEVKRSDDEIFLEGDGFWVSIQANGKLEIGEPAA